MSQAPGRQSSLETLRPYFPRTLIEQHLAHANGPAVWGEWLEGSLMHCDVTGFTAMSERLAVVGKEGAEIMAATLDRFFERMLGIAARWGGDQMKFGGDAMLLYFGGHSHALNAAACAMGMQQAMSEFRHIDAGGQHHQFRMRIGIHSGRFLAASIGHPRRLLHYFLTGSDVNRVAAVEPMARPGEVAISTETAALLGDSVLTSPLAGDVLRLRRLACLPEIPPREQTRGDLPPMLAQYSMPPLRRARGRGTVTGEHRRVTTIFVNLLGVADLLNRRGDVLALEEVDAYVKLVIDAAEAHGGHLAASDASDHGDKLILLFGAPVAQERQELNAVRAALAIQAEMRSAGLHLTSSIGVNAGYVFAGEIGSSMRREYTVIGDAVNLAARLMTAAAPGETIVSAPTIERYAAEFALARMRPLRVKGKQAPVRAFRLKGATLASPQAQRTQLFGRQRDMTCLMTQARRARRGRLHWALVSGEPGMGKSSLVSAFRDRLRRHGWVCVSGECHSHTTGVPFTPWRAMLSELLAAGGSLSYQTLSSRVSTLVPGQDSFAPLLADLLSVPVPPDSDLSPMPSSFRRERLAELIVALLQAAAQEGPLFLLFDDIQWADEPSLELLHRLLSQPQTRILVCVTSRLAEPPLAGLTPDLELQLEPLSGDDALELLTTGSTLSRQQAGALIDRGRGNPLFLQELMRGASEGLGELPDTVNDVILARLDRLSPNPRSVVRLAAVIGPNFDVGCVGAIAKGTLDRRAVSRALSVLAGEGFIQPREPGTYAFHHALVQEVAYETLPFARRRRLHGGVISYLEAGQPDQLTQICEILLHHAERSADCPRVVRYAAMSGDRAAVVFANESAISYYRRALEALDGLKRGTAVERSVLLERIGDCLETIGRHRDAATTFIAALEAWRSARRQAYRPGRRAGRTFLRTAESAAARDASLCQKIAVSLERGSDYDASLEWLDEGLASTPKRAARLAARLAAGKSVAFLRKGNYDQGIAWGRSAVALALRSRDAREIAHARNMLANSYIESGHMRQAIQQLRKAVRLYHELKDFPGQASANNNLGACYHLLGTLDAALYYYQVALEADRRIGDAVDVAVASNNVGEVLLTLGRTDEAIEHLMRVVDAARQNEDITAVAGLSEINLCRCYMMGRRYADAGEHLKRGVGLLRRVGAEGLLAEAEIQRAELLLARGKDHAAVRSARSALASAHRLGAALLEARAGRVLGQALSKCGRTPRAEECFRTSLALARRVGADYEEARTSIALAELLLANRRRSSRAQPLLRNAARVFSRMGAEPDLRRVTPLLEEAVA